MTTISPLLIIYSCRGPRDSQVTSYLPAGYLQTISLIYLLVWFDNNLFLFFNFDITLKCQIEARKIKLDFVPYITYRNMKSIKFFLQLN